MKSKRAILAALLAMVLLSGCTLTAQRSPVGSQPADQTGSTQPKESAPAPAGGTGSGSGASSASPEPGQPAEAQPAQPVQPVQQPGSGGSGGNAATPAPVDVEAKLVVPAKAKRSQPVTFGMEIKNNIAAMTITYRSGQYYDFWVEQNGREVWRWSRGRMFTQALVNQTLNAGAVLQFSAQWDGQGRDGKPVAPGTYTVHARWLAQTELAATPQPVPVQFTWSR